MSVKKAPRKRSSRGRRSSVAADEMRPEYDFRGGSRGKYARRFGAGANVAVLDPNVAARFPAAEAVNRPLRAIVKIAVQTESPRKSRRRTA